MPIYEFKCLACGKRFQKLVGIIAEQSPDVSCIHCGSQDIKKLISRFRSIRSEDQLLDDLADFGSDDDIDDPRKLGRWIKEVGKTLDEDPGELEEMLETSIDDAQSDGD